MSLHKDINEHFVRAHADKADCICLTPSALAYTVFKSYCSVPLEPHIEYTSLEHLKHMARRFLARQHEVGGNENRAYAGEQGEFFSGELQDRYPLPKKEDCEPEYKLREHLTSAEAKWNLSMLRKKSVGFALHADAFEAWMDARIERSAA